MKNIISIIIVNYNGKKWLKKCLDSLYAQTYKNFEIIFVDNASVDDSVAFVRSNYPEIKIVISKKNLGFAGGNTLGFKYAKGEYVLLLNNDTWAEKDYLLFLLEAFTVIPNLGSVQSKIILMNEPDKLDVCGSYWTDSSFLYHFGMGQDQSKKKYNTPMPFFSNKGASMMLKKEVIDKIGFLDDDFWSYYEETDLCNRIWLSGYECWYYPKAIIHHAVGGTAITFSNSFIQFHNFKNKLMSFLKNFELTTLVKILPIYFIFNFLLSIFWIFQGKMRHFLALYQAIWWNLNHFNKTLKKRSEIQLLRKKADLEYFKIVKKNPKLNYFYSLVIGSRNYEE